MPNEFQIIPYSEKFKVFVKSLNEEWLRKYFTIEKTDQIQLSDPKKEILDKGGKIFFANYNDHIVGTISLIRIDDETYELSKMAVTEKFQGKGIGKMLIEFSINQVKESGMKKLILYSSTKLLPAIHLYRKYGFREVPLVNSLYKRSDIKMEKDLE
jgi:ribosomal protein S18 acetylase RimI-like enzyme